MEDGITDLHIHLPNPAESLVFPGPRRPNDMEQDLISALLTRMDALPKDDFMVTVGEWFFRGHRDRRTVDGEWVRMRRMACVPPDLDHLPSPFPPAIAAIAMSPALLSGGLIYVIGAPGMGKTMTCSATLVSRLKKFGGYAYTVEDPPELPLNGWHGEGYCSQSWVEGDTSADWQDAFRGVLRGQPTGTPCILYVGEVRDPESAASLIRAASSGFLVLATGFGADIPAALDALVRLAAVDETDQKRIQDVLAGVLRLVLHQRICDSRLMVRALVSASGTSAPAAKIRHGLYPRLEGDVQYQANQMMAGIDVFRHQQGKAD